MKEKLVGWSDACRRVVAQWFRNRMRECVRCFECDGEVSPWDAHCPQCGQAHPSRVSATAGVYLAIGFGVLAVAGWSLMRIV